MSMLLLLFGDIGAGKTTVAQALSEKCGFALVQFDPLVFSVTGKKNMYGDDGSFLLSDEEIEEVHAAMRARAKELLASGGNVIVESMYFKPQREQMLMLAETMGVPFRIVEVVCDEEEIKRRLARRRVENKQSAGVELFLEDKGHLGEEGREHNILDTTGKSVAECMEEVMRAIGLE